MKYILAGLWSVMAMTTTQAQAQPQIHIQLQSQVQGQEQPHSEASMTSAPKHEFIFDTRTGERLTLTEAAQRVPPETIVTFGEEHVTPDNQSDPSSVAHHENQLRWLLELKAVDTAASTLGMEFLEYPTQPLVEQFLSAKMTEAEFLKSVRWGSNPFAPYNHLMQATAASGGTVALNIPREIAREVSKNGPEALSPEQRAQVPPLWERGGPLYFERFASTMSGHVSQDKIERYFWAQSLWDDTMAWQAVEHMAPTQPQTPARIMTIIVGAFHVEFGHGLPARLQAHGAKSILTMVQAEVEDWNETILSETLAPDPHYGARADYIWVYKR